MRFARRPRCEYLVTDRKRAAAARWQRRQRASLPLLAPLIAEGQPSVEQVMAERVMHWASTEQEWRDRRAAQWLYRFSVLPGDGTFRTTPRFLSI